jgi:recombination protein RecT
MNDLTVLKQDVGKMHGEFAKSLPGHITADKFVRTAQTAIALTRNIERVKNTGSLLAACSKAAADGLILDGREAALVVDYNGDVQYRPMMRGLLKLAYNSGEIRNIVVETVRDNDVFRYTPTADEPISHEINMKSARGEVYAYYALAKLRDGGVVHEVMTKEDVHRIRDRSDAWKAFKAGKIKSTPWHTDEIEMGRKTVFRRLSKYLPSSTDRDLFRQAVERIDDDYTFEADADAGGDVSTPRPATKKRGGAAAALKNVTPKAKPQREEPDFDPQTGEIYEDRGEDIPNAGDDF